MSENRSLNSLFARLDESKANRANEANREHEKAAEEAEKERQKKKVEESAVEKYRVYDDDYEPEVMIPKGNPGAMQQPAKPKTEKKETKEQEMDEITDGNPFINTLFRRSNKTQSPTAAAKPLRNLLHLHSLHRHRSLRLPTFLPWTMSRKMTPSYSSTFWTVQRALTQMPLRAFLSPKTMGLKLT